MINSALLSTINKTYKLKDLQSIYDNNNKKLTANNVNAILSALTELHDSDIELQYNLNDLIDSLRQSLSNTDDQLSTAIQQISGFLAALKAQSKDLYAISAIYAGYVVNKLSLTTNINEKIQYNGSSNKQINCILSSIYTSSALSANNAEHAISANHALSSNTTLSANYAKEANHSINADLALSAKQVEHNLIVMNGEYHELQLYNGSKDVLISSVLYSTSSLYSFWATTAMYAAIDSEGYDINTYILHNFNEENKDYPLLFSEATYDKIENQEKYSVNFHNQIVINPYLGAIKANLFFGTALSSSYAIADKDKILLNTRVVQNSTSNNYEYPILLSFISKKENQDTMTDCDGEKNETLYTEVMRINPNLNLIKSGNEDEFESDLTFKDGNTTLAATTDQELTIHVTQEQTYSVNFEGLATRALADQDGYEIGKKIWLSGHNSNVPSAARPLIFPLLTNKDLPGLYRDQIGFCSSLFINPLDGSLSSNGNLFAFKNIYAKENIEATKNIISKNNTLTQKELHVSGISYLKNALNVTGVTNLSDNLNVTKATNLKSTLDVTGVSNLSSTLNVKGVTNLQNILNVTGVTNLNNSLNVKGATNLQNTLDVTKATKLNDSLTVTKATKLNDSLTVTKATTLNSTLEVIGATTLKNTLTVTNAAVLNSTLTVAKATKLNDSLTVAKATNLQSTLDVTGATKLKSTLNVTNAATLNNSLTVTGVVDFKSNATITGWLNVDKNIHTNADFGANGNLNIKGDAQCRSLKATANISCQMMYGVATSAQWADLAENYETDIDYPIGTLVCFGGQKEITIATNEVNGVISNQPAYLMNSKCKGQPIALVGRVPVLVKGIVNKFDYITISDQPGIGISAGKNKPNNLIGRALKTKNNNNIQLIECIIQLSL